MGDSIKALVVKNNAKDEEQLGEDEDNNEETELQKNIRLGDVTAFGNSLQTKSSSGLEKVNFDNYLQQQIDSQGPSSSSSTVIKKRRHSESDDSDSGFVDVPKNVAHIKDKSRKQKKK